MKESDENSALKRQPTLDEALLEIVRLERMVAKLTEANQGLERILTKTSAALEKATVELNERVAEQRRLENEYRLSAERYSTLIHNIPGAVYRCANDDAWTMEFVSGRVEEVSGYPPSDFIGNSVRTYASIIHPDDVLHVVEKVQEALNAKRPYVIEYRIIHADGSIRWVYEEGQGVFDYNGEFLYLDGVIFDITDMLAAPGRRMLL
jgi:PAS domain S-box-containing protein